MMNTTELMTEATKGSRVTESQSSTGKRTTPATSLELAIASAQTAQANNGRDIVILDMRNVTALFDYFVIATGTSQRQISAMSDEIQFKLEKELNDKRYSNHSVDRSNWIVLDYGTVVIHLFDEESRQFYSLEALWGDSPRVEWDVSTKPQSPENT
ncbi:MAG: ribosome silencing factor [Pirellulaceae bacterium]